MSTRFIDKYEIVSTLGRGSMGVVYKGKDPEIGRLVAIKTLKAVFMGDDPAGAEALQRFRQESRSAGRLHHPNIVTIFEAGRTEGGSPYIVMEYIEGQSLEAMVAEKGRIAPVEVLHYLAQVASAVDYAHSQNVIHRDIKPSNIIVDQRHRPQLLDFGVAKLSDTSLTPAGTVVGTPSYMSPEQIRGTSLDGRTDIFSLAVVAYECFTGVRPFPGNDFTTVVSNIIHKDPLPFNKNADLSRALELALLKGLAKDREQRYENALSLAQAVASAFEVQVDGSGLVGGYRAGMTLEDARAAAGSSRPSAVAPPVSAGMNVADAPEAALAASSVPLSAAAAPAGDVSADAAVASHAASSMPSSSATPSSAIDKGEGGAAGSRVEPSPSKVNGVDHGASALFEEPAEEMLDKTTLNNADADRLATLRSASRRADQQASASGAGSDVAKVAMLGGVAVAFIVLITFGYYFFSEDDEETQETASTIKVIDLSDPATEQTDQPGGVDAEPAPPKSVEEERLPSYTAASAKALNDDELRTALRGRNLRGESLLALLSEAIDRKSDTLEAAAEEKVKEAPDEALLQGLALQVSSDRAQKLLLEELGRRGNEEFAPVLLARLGDPNFVLRVAALKGLESSPLLKRTDIRDAVLERLNDPEYLVRGFAVKVLTGSGDQQVLDALEARDKIERKEIVRNLIKKALGR